MPENEDDDGFFDEIEQEDEEEDLLLCVGEDGVLREYVPLPSIIFEFEDEEGLLCFMQKLLDAGISKMGSGCLIKNVEETFFDGFEELKLGFDRMSKNEDGEN